MNLAVETVGAAETDTPAARGSRWSRVGRTLRYVAVVLLLLLVALARPISQHARAASLLVSFSGPGSSEGLVEERVSFDGIPARLYTPAGVANAPGVVLVHGVHRKGIEEPRLERFARAVASTGVVVMTPEVSDLSDYHVAPRSIDTVGKATQVLRARLQKSHVGVMGTSFGGGIALLTAADPRFATGIAYVVAIGAHDDLWRVSRFFATDEIVESTGAIKHMHAHEYGATVLVYDHAEDFFPSEDVPAAREALRLWLWEQREAAREAAKTLSAPSKEKVEKLFAADLASIRPEILAEIEQRKAAMKLVSPHDRLRDIQARVYLLHGEGDSVIPATESVWLATEVPKEKLGGLLVSPAIQHVELKEPKTSDKLALVHFMARVMGEADATK